MTSKMFELTQLDRVKSIIRYFPPKGTAGFVRLAVRIPNREPSPPARITARVFIWSSLSKPMFDNAPYINQRNVPMRNPEPSPVVGFHANARDCGSLPGRG